MRIMHLEASSGWGGQEIRILRESEGMRARGHHVILGVSRGGGLVDQARRAGFLVYELDFRRVSWPICFFQLLKIFRSHEIDLINTHSSLDSWIGGMAARAGGRQIVRTRHLSTPIKKGWNSRILYGTLADFVVTTCSAIVPMISQQSGKPLSKCRSIATGVDPKKIAFDPQKALQFREQLRVKREDFLIGTACFMRSWKGIDDLLYAADRLRSHTDIRWVVIGGGHAARHLEKAKELRLEEIVHFTGHLEHPFPALGALDLFTLLSTAHEGVSQAILQAAFLGKPLVATPVGGLHEVCIDRKTGILVPPFSPDAIARAVLEIKQNQNLQKLFGRQGRLLVEEKFTLQHTLDQMEEVYRQVIVGNSAPL